MTNPESRIYVGRLDAGCPAVYAVGCTSVERLLPLDDDFRWGDGAGDAGHELARVLLADASGGGAPAEACRRFSEQILSRLPQDGFALQRDTVSAWLRRFVTVSS